MCLEGERINYVNVCTKLKYIYLSNSHHLSRMSKLLCWKTICEKICRIMICIHLDKLDVLAVKYIFDKEILQLYVLRLCMKDRIPC